LVKKLWVEIIEGASVVSWKEPLRRMDNGSFVTSLTQQQHSFSPQPCCPQKDPLHQSIDLLPSSASVEFVVS
jgi:hypothetical protein